MRAPLGRADHPDMPLFGRITRLWVWRSEGQTAAEYAVVLGVITPIIALAYIALGDSVAPIINRVVSYL